LCRLVPEEAINKQYAVISFTNRISIQIARAVKKEPPKEICPNYSKWKVKVFAATSEDYAADEKEIGS
jgi:hypothetical protein